MKIRQDISSIGAGNMICVNGLSIHQNMLRVVNEKKNARMFNRFKICLQSYLKDFMCVRNKTVDIHRPKSNDHRHSGISYGWPIVEMTANQTY